MRQVYLDHLSSTPLLPEAAYDRSLADEQPWFRPRGGRLPMAMAGADQAAPGPAYYASLLRSPFADQLSLEFALAAVRGAAPFPPPPAGAKPSQLQFTIPYYFQ